MDRESPPGHKATSNVRKRGKHPRTKSVRKPHQREVSQRTWPQGPVAPNKPPCAITHACAGRQRAQKRQAAACCPARQPGGSGAKTNTNLPEGRSARKVCLMTASNWENTSVKREKTLRRRQAVNHNIHKNGTSSKISRRELRNTKNEITTLLVILQSQKRSQDSGGSDT